MCDYGGEEDWYTNFKTDRDVDEIICKTIRDGAAGASEELIHEAIHIVQDSVRACDTLAESQALAISKYSKEWLDFIESHRLKRAERVANDVCSIIEGTPAHAFKKSKQIRILDLGCGDAAVAAILAGRGYSVNCCDIEDYRLGDEAKKLPFLKIHTNSDFNFIDEDDATFDICLILYVMHHMKQEDQTNLLHRLFKAKSFSHILVFEDAHPNLDTYADRDAILNNFFQIPPAALIPMPRSYHSIDDWKLAFSKENSYCKAHDLDTYALLQEGQPLSAKAPICHFFHLAKSDTDSSHAAIVHDDTDASLSAEDEGEKDDLQVLHHLSDSSRIVSRSTLSSP